MYNAKVTSDATFDISAYSLVLTQGTNLNDFVDGKVTAYINGVDYEITGTGKTFTASADRFRVEAGAPVTVKVVGNVKSNAATVPADYVFTLNLTEAKNVSNGSTVALTKSQAGDKVTVKNGTLIVKDATLAPGTARAVYANADLEIGRFALRAEAEKVTVRKLTVTNAGTLTGFGDVISSNSAKLIDVSTNSEVSATVTVSGNTIIFENISTDVLKDTDRNFKVVVTTAGFGTGVHGQTIDLGVTVNTADKASGGAATLSPATLAAVSSSDYIIGVKPPVLTLTKKSSNVFLLTIANADSESDVVINEVTAQVKPVATSNNTYTADFCLRLEGTNDADRKSVV